MANTDPIFPQVPHIQYVTVLLGDNAYILNKSSMYKTFTAGNNGSFLSKIKINPLGTNAATVLRFFLSKSTDTHGSVFHEVNLPATTQGNTALNAIDLSFDIPLEANCELWVTSSVALTAGVSVICMTGDY